MDSNLLTLIGVVVLLLILAGLYKFFYRDRKTDGKDELNWVNDSNYNIATSDSEAEVLENATPAEAQHIVDVNKKEGPYPPSDEEFHDLEKKLDGKPKDTGSVREQLKDV